MTWENKKTQPDKGSKRLLNIREDELFVYIFVLIHAIFIDILLAILIGGTLILHAFARPGSGWRIFTHIFGTLILIFYAAKYLIPMLLD